MEIRYPLLLVLFPIIIIIYLLYPEKKKKIKTDKIANTSFVKENAYYKRLLKRYQRNKIILIISYGVAILSSILLCARPISIQQTNESKREIILCMDVSESVDTLNLEIIESLEKTVKSLKEEQFGISMFNTTSVLVSPLTEDHEFIENSLEEIKESIQLNINIKNNQLTNPEDFYYTRNFIYAGLLEKREERGTSLIGDGLTSCIYHFPEQEKEKVKILILTTDNEENGTSMISLSEAAKISKENHIILYGIGTKEMKEENKEEMKKAVEKTGGVFYTESEKTTQEIIKEIEKTSKSYTIIKKEKKENPTILFMILLSSISIIILLSKKVIR